MSSLQDTSVAWPGKIAVGESVRRLCYEVGAADLAASVARRRRAWLDGNWRLFVGIAKAGLPEEMLYPQNNDKHKH